MNKIIDIGYNNGTKDEVMGTIMEEVLLESTLEWRAWFQQPTRTRISINVLVVVREKLTEEG